MIIFEIAIISLLALASLIALVGFIGFAVMVYAMMQVYKDDNR